MVYFKPVGFGQYVLIDVDTRDLALAGEVKEDSISDKLQELFEVLLRAIARKEG